MYRSDKYLIEGQLKGTPYSETTLDKIFHKYLGRVYKKYNFIPHYLRHNYKTH
jgi:hypothetical protein